MSQRTWGWWAMTAFGWALIATAAAWWAATYAHGRLWGAQYTRIPAWKFLAFDFQHNYDATRLWLSGGNPYTQDFGDWRGRFAYPPIVLPLFAWCGLVSQTVAAPIWMGAITAAMALGGWAAQRTRAALGLVPLPFVLIVGLLVCSMPVVFATERGQTDAIVLALVVVAGLALRRPGSWGRDLLVAACLALAAWVKVYPALLILALLTLRQWRSFGLSVLIALLIGVVPWRATVQFVDAARASQEDRVGFITEIGQWLSDPAGHRPAQLKLYPTISVDAHSLTTYWGSFWTYFDLPAIQRVPGVIGALLILGPPTLWVSARMFRATGPTRGALAYPLLLWLAAAATFVMPVSYDYNLFYLPLAALAVCDRRDPVLVGLAILATVAWCQPLKVPIPNAKDLLMFLKLFSLAGVGISLLVRARELDRALPDAPHQAAPAAAAPAVVA